MIYQQVIVVNNDLSKINNANITLTIYNSSKTISDNIYMYIYY